MRAVALLSIALLAGGCIENDLAQGTPNTRPYEDDGTSEIPDDIAVGGVAGRICTPSELTWVVGAAVWVDHEYGKTSTFTDADGFFELAPVPAGTHTVHVNKGSFDTTFEVDFLPDLIVDLETGRCLSDVEIGVVSGDYDSIEVVLGGLGFDYTLIDGHSYQQYTLLTTPSELEKYDVVFFNCGMSDGWISDSDKVAETLRDYVAAGGSVYASDWSYWLVEVAFPEMLDFLNDDAVFSDAMAGSETREPILADVVDLDMASALGTTSAEISYDLADWAAVVGAGDPDYVLIRGTYDWWSWQGNGTASGPLAARMHSGDGTVLYTSFHNEAQKTSDMEILLQQIILSL